MKRAHEYELKQVKKSYLEIAEQIITSEVARLQKTVSDEFARFADRENAQRDYSLK